MERLHRRNLAARALGTTVRVLGWIVLGLVSVVVIAFAAANLKVAREYIRKTANAALAETFVGTLSIERIGYVGLTSVGGLDIRGYDATHREVLDARGLKVTSVWPGLVLDLVLGRPLTVTLDSVTCDHLVATLLDDGNGSPSVTELFQPRDETPSSDSESTTTILLPAIGVRHVWARGGFGALQVVDTELFDLDAAVAVRQNAIDLQLNQVRISARALPAQLDPNGLAYGRLTLPTSESVRPTAVLAFVGEILASPADLRVRLLDGNVRGHFHASEIPATALRALVPSLVVASPSRIEADVAGALPVVQVNAVVDNDDSRAVLQGTIELSEPLHANIDLSVAVPDSSRWIDAPSVSVAATARADIGMTEHGEVLGTYSVEVAPTAVMSEPTPALLATGTFSRDLRERIALAGSLDASERGADLALTYGIKSDPQGRSVLDARLQLQLDDPPRLARHLGVQLRGSVGGSLRLDLANQQLSALANLDLSRVVSDAARADKLHLKARASGRADSPQLEVEAIAEGVEAAQRRFRTITANAGGTLERLSVQAKLDRAGAGTTTAAATISFAPRLSLLRPVVTFASKEGDISLRANDVAIDNGKVQIQGFELAGAGTMTADAQFSDGRVESRFVVNGLQVARILRALELDSPLTSGNLWAEGTVSGSLRALQGQVYAHADSIDMDQIRGGTVELQLALDDRRINGGIEAKLGPSAFMAHLDNVRMPTVPVTQASLMKTTGTISIVGDVDLDRVAPMLRTMGVPVERAHGKVSMDVIVENVYGAPNGPRAHLQLRTKQLRLVEQRPPRANVDSVPAALETQPASLEGIDFDIDLLVDPEARQTKLHANAFDRHGSLVELKARAETANLLEIDSFAALRIVPMTVQLTTPRRELSRLPLLIRPKVIHGEVSADLVLAGSMGDPKLAGRVEARGLKSRKERRGLDGALRIGYSKEGGAATLDARTARRHVATLASSWTGDLATAILAPSGGTPFTLDANLNLTRFPVGIIPALSDRSLRGAVDLDLSLRNWGKAAELEARLDGQRLRIGDSQLEKFDVSLRAGDRELTAAVDAGHKKGTLVVKVSTPMKWGSALVPDIDPKARATLRARQFPLAALGPMVQGTLSEVDGTLDADFNVELTEDAPRMRGYAALRNGVAHVPQIGQRFTDIAARVSIDNGDIRVDSFEARGTTGKVEVSARARLRGSELESVKGRVDIAEKEKLPITYEGVEIGEAWGHLDLEYVKTEGSQEIRVDVPNLHVELPNSSMNNVQDLDPDKHIRVGVYRADGTFAALPLQPLDAAASDETGDTTLTRVRIRLGDAVWLERPGQARVQLAGELLLTADKETRLDGKIELRSGKLDVKGKTFEIERGTVAFAGTETSNPVITATARWDAPAGYAVYAEYSGTVEAGKLRLHSEPQLTQNEIISLLLFGSPEGSLGANDSGGGAAAAAVGIAGDSAVKGFNRVVSDFTNLDVSARIDTSTGSARPELVVQVSPRVTTRVTRALGQPAPGQSPDRTFLTLEFRLRRNWSLSGVVGDRGASWLDLIWRKRY